MARILLVDDDTELASMLKEYLELEGYEVMAVNDGEAGVEEARSGRYALVVLDVMMPRLNGIEALRRIRSESLLPVLMLTAKGDDVDRVLGLELGADDYVPKPCTPGNWPPASGPSCAGPVPPRRKPAPPAPSAPAH